MPLSKIHNTLTSDHILLDGTDSTGANANSRVLLDASASDTDEGIIMSYEAGADDASVALTPSSFTLDALNVSGTTTFESAVTAEAAFAIPNSGTIGSASSTSAISIASTGIVTFVDDIKIKDGGTIGTATNPAALTLGAAGKLTVALKTQSTGFIVADDGYIGSVSDTDLLQFSSTGQSFFQSDDVGWLPVNIRRAISTANAGTGLSFQLGDSASATAGHIYGEIRAHIEDNTNGAEDGYLVLRTSLSGTSAEKVRVASNGLVTFQGNLVLQDDGTIGCASDTDLVTIGDGVVTVAGNVTLSGATNTVTAQNTPKWNSTAQSTNFTAAVQNQYFIDTSGGAFTMTLPSTANIGDEIRVVDGVGSFDTNNLTIARNGHKIQRDASDLTITTEGAAFALVYYNSTNGWLLKDR